MGAVSRAMRRLDALKLVKRCLRLHTPLSRRQLEELPGLGGIPWYAAAVEVHVSEHELCLLVALLHSSLEQLGSSVEVLWYAAAVEVHTSEHELCLRVALLHSSLEQLGCSVEVLRHARAREVQRSELSQGVAMALLGSALEQLHRQSDVLWHAIALTEGHRRRKRVGGAARGGVAVMISATAGGTATSDALPTSFQGGARGF